jgi:LysM repeat protein
MRIVVVVILLAHAAAIGTLLSTQGCQTSTPRVEAPPAPPLPPQNEPLPGPVPQSGILRPPSPVKLDAERAVQAEATTVEVQKGETLSQIAAQHGLTTRELADLNAITDPNRVRIGQKLILPGYATRVSLPKTPAKPKPTPALAPVRSAPVAGGAEYTVKKGDSLSRIAQVHKVRVADLKTLNRLESDRIREGQKLVLPATAVHAEPAPVPEPVTAPADPTPVAPAIPPAFLEETLPSVPEVPDQPVIETPVPATPAPDAPSVIPEETTGKISTFPYPVGTGDTIESIAKNFVVDPAVLIQLNPGIDPAHLKPGTRIQIPLTP